MGGGGARIFTFLYSCSCSNEQVCLYDERLKCPKREEDFNWFLGTSDFGCNIPVGYKALRKGQNTSKHTEELTGQTVTSLLNPQILATFYF